MAFSMRNNGLFAYNGLSHGFLTNFHLCGSSRLSVKAIRISITSTQDLDKPAHDTVAEDSTEGSGGDT